MIRRTDAISKATRADLTANNCKFRVLAVDVETDPTAIYVTGDFVSLIAAEKAATQSADVVRPVYVYNDKAKLIVRFGSWH